MNTRTEDDVKFFEEKIYSRYVPLFRFLYTICADKELCQDIVQETMATCWEKLDLVRGYQDIAGAVATIGRNKLRDHYRGARLQAKIVDAPMEIVLAIAGDDCDFDRLIREDRNRELMELINQLKPEYTRMILMYYYYEMSLQDVAETMNVKYNTVLSWHRRSLKALGRMAEEAGLGVRRSKADEQEKLEGWDAEPGLVPGNG